MLQKRTVFVSLLALFVGTTADARDYGFGADLSYVNEMQDCGAPYSYRAGQYTLGMEHINGGDFLLASTRP